jgi:hypothetical protein
VKRVAGKNMSAGRMDFRDIYDGSIESKAITKIAGFLLMLLMN